MKQPIRLQRPKLFSADQLHRIRETGAVILAECGLLVLHEEARAMAERAGLRLRGNRVFPERKAIDAFLDRSQASGSTSQDAGPDRGGRLTVHACQYATHLHDLETDHVVPLSVASVTEAAKLIDVLSEDGVIGGAPGPPADVPNLLQPLAQYRIQAVHCRHGREAPDPRWARSLPYVMEMAEVLGEPIRWLPVYVVSPLTIGTESLASVLSVRDRLEGITTGNMPSVGATTPVRIGHALALGIAEVAGSAMVLEAITGLPVHWASIAMAFDFRGLAMSFGSPEQMLFRWATEEVNAFCHGREPGVPSGYAALRTQAKLPGAQASAEKMAGAVVAAAMGARDLDGAGVLSLDEVFSAEQLVVDCEIRDHVARLTAGVDADCDPAACLAEVQAALDGGFMSLDTTLDTYRQVYWLPRLFERRSLGGWKSAGCPDMRGVAKEIARERVKDHSYRLPEDLGRELDSIYARAEAELAG